MPAEKKAKNEKSVPKGKKQDKLKLEESSDSDREDSPKIIVTDLKSPKGKKGTKPAKGKDAKVK